MPTINIPVSTDLKGMIERAARSALPHAGRPMAQWMRQVLEEAANKELKKVNK